METPTGTLDKFHLGVSADGQTCMMVFVDEDQRTIRCVADFSEFNAFIANLNRAAAEMMRRRHEEGRLEVRGRRVLIKDFPPTSSTSGLTNPAL